MMAPRNLARLVLRGAMQNRRRLALHTFGLVIGIASFAFFLSLSMAVRGVVLEDLFPLDEVEVVAPRVGAVELEEETPEDNADNADDAGNGAAEEDDGGEEEAEEEMVLDDAIVQEIRAHPDVEEVVPRMAMAFPASGEAVFYGNRFPFEAGGFADGVDPDYLEDEEFAELFQDWEDEEGAGDRAACGPPPERECENGDLYYCDARDNTCRKRVPIVVSRTLVEIYNAQLAPSYGLPEIDDAMEDLLTSRAGRELLRLEIDLGRALFAGGFSDVAGSPRTVDAMVVGISDKAMQIGVTVPIGYMERWNREFVGDGAAEQYSSIEVVLSDREAVAPFSAWVQEELGLALEDRQAERFATAIFIVTALFVLISLAIVTIAAINIAHSFFLQVAERRRELGVLRAIGGTRADIRTLVLAEAGVIGLLGGLAGLALARLGAAIVDTAAHRWLPAFPFKPDSFFAFEWWIVASGLACAVIFAVIGGFFPARRAARMPPAQALAQD